MPDLPPVIRALLDPAIYPHPAHDLQLIQTHVSYVVLAGNFAYKVKKPVDFGFLNFSTLGRRGYYCRKEVVLNSRLCSDTYLGVVAIRETNGAYSLGGRGQIVEYAVQMRRLPQERMMDQLLAAGKLTPEMVRAVADKVARFHEAAETSPRIAEYGAWAIRYAWDENIQQWQPYVGQTVTPEQNRILTAFGEAFFARKKDVLRHRVEQLRIREGHSDLRSDAVCLEDGVCIMDCVEFNRRIRLVDVARDVGFLAMDLDYRDAPRFGQTFVDRYIEVSGDEEMRQIIDFYKSYNACVRGKVDGFRLSQPEVPEAEQRQARAAARRYFHLACKYAESLPPAMLIITCGLAGAGKSTVARSIARASGAEIVSSDVVRKQLLGVAPRERHFDEYGTGLYAAELRERTYEAMFERARSLLLAGKSVVLDASFIRREQRRRAARLARETGAQYACVEVVASPSEVRRRLDARLRRGVSASDARWEIYIGQKRQFQRPTEVPPERRLVVDSGKPAKPELRGVIEGLRRLSPLSVRGWR